MPLTDREGNMVPELEGIVREWFQMYSLDLNKEQIIEISKSEGPEINDENPLDESIIPDTIRAMTRDTCVEFVKAMTTLEKIEKTDDRVTKFFKNYSRALGNTNLILVDEMV